MTVDCLGSILPDLLDHWKCVVVDNASGDGSVKKINDWIISQGVSDKISVISSSVNTGFSGGNNIGISNCTAKYYLLLNSDTQVISGSIAILLDEAKKNPSAGLITPRLEFENGMPQESCFHFHSPISEFLNAVNIGILDRLFSGYRVPIPASNSKTNPDWSSFACVLIKGELIETIGMLDDGYFMYYEDAEFCHRSRMAGWDVLNVPKARVVHLRGKSSPVKSSTEKRKRLPLYYYESRTRYFYQVYGYAGLFFANLLWWFGRSFSKTRQVMGRNDKAVSEKQWLDIWTNFNKPLKPYIHPDTYK